MNLEFTEFTLYRKLEFVIDIEFNKMSASDLKRSAEEAKLEDSEDETDFATVKSKHLAIEKEKATMARKCPYLDTINRNVLDFGESQNCLGDILF